MIVKKINLKKGIVIEGEKLWKQVRGQKFGNESENGNMQVEHRPQCLLYLEQNSKAFAITILTAI